MTSLTIRYDDDMHRDLKVIAAYEDTSLNNLIVMAFKDFIDAWEKENPQRQLPSREQK